MVFSVNLVNAISLVKVKHPLDNVVIILNIARRVNVIAVERKTWTQVASAEHTQGSLSIELRADQARKQASAAQARLIREPVAKAQADQVPRVNTQRNQTNTHQAKKRKTFGGYQKW